MQFEIERPVHSWFPVYMCYEPGELWVSYSIGSNHPQENTLGLIYAIVCIEKKNCINKSKKIWNPNKLQALGRRTHNDLNGVHSQHEL